MSDDPFTIDDAKLKALAEFAAGAGHEINNPLAIILGKAQLLLKSEDDPRRRSDLSAIAGQALRIRQMIGDLMLFARPPEPVKKRFSAHDALHSVITKLAPEAVERGVTLRLEQNDEAELIADQTQFEIVIAELTRNAMEACLRSAETADKLVRIISSAGTQELTVQVIDNGVGFSEKDREHAFDPFYSGRAAGRGLGFGLCKVWRIAQSHAATLSISSRPGETSVEIRWPVA